MLPSSMRISLFSFNFQLLSFSPLSGTSSTPHLLSWNCSFILIISSSFRVLSTSLSPFLPPLVSWLTHLLVTLLISSWCKSSCNHGVSLLSLWSWATSYRTLGLTCSSLCRHIRPSFNAQALTTEILFTSLSLIYVFLDAAACHALGKRHTSTSLNGMP
jgi:hypothetical protein